jgi:hypothetical protein
VSAPDHRPVVATTFSPRNVAGQSKAMQTWVDAGFRVHVLNWPEELSALPKSGPDVSYLAAPEESRSGFSPMVPLDALADHLRGLTPQPESHVGIVNSDVYLSDPARLQQALAHAEFQLVFSSRLEVSEADAIEGEPHDDGYDCFFFSPIGIASLPRSPFLLGVPWWDFWPPVSLLLRGLRIGRLVQPVVKHIQHENRWSSEQWLDVGRQFYTSVLQVNRGTASTRLASTRRADLRRAMARRKIAMGPTRVSDFSLRMRGFIRGAVSAQRGQALRTRPGVKPLADEAVGELAFGMLEFIRGASEPA